VAARASWLCAAVLAALVLAPGPAPAAAPPCSPAAAKAAILAQPSRKSLRPTIRSGGGVDRLFCHDLTRDGVDDMAATVFSGGTAGDIAWVVFRRSGGSWVLALKQLNLYKVGLFRLGGDLADTQPVYRATDPNCCPSGGFDHRRFHWNGSRFAVVRRWHDKLIHP
jgi:hypothetical protein